RAGMEHAATSPFYPAWVAGAEADLAEARAAIRARDLEALGLVAEHSALEMHAVGMAARPPLLYWRGATVDCLDRVWKLRAEGTPAFVTIDAGPQVKVLCTPDDARRVAEALRAVPGVERVLTCAPGERAREALPRRGVRRPRGRARAGRGRRSARACPRRARARRGPAGGRVARRGDAARDLRPRARRARRRRRRRGPGRAAQRADGGAVSGGHACPGGGRHARVPRRRPEARPRAQRRHRRGRGGGLARRRRAPGPGRDPQGG